jgi:hypothetical protein
MPRHGQAKGGLLTIDSCGYGRCRISALSEVGGVEATADY